MKSEISLDTGLLQKTTFVSHKVSERSSHSINVMWCWEFDVITDPQMTTTDDHGAAEKRDKWTVIFCDPDTVLFYKTQSKSKYSPKDFSNVRSKSKWGPKSLKNAAFSQKNALFLFRQLSPTPDRILCFKEIYRPDPIQNQRNLLQSGSRPMLTSGSESRDQIWARIRTGSRLDWTEKIFVDLMWIFQLYQNFSGNPISQIC